MSWRFTTCKVLSQALHMCMLSTITRRSLQVRQDSTCSRRLCCTTQHRIQQIFRMEYPWLCPPAARPQKKFDRRKKVCHNNITMGNSQSNSMPGKKLARCKRPAMPICRPPSRSKSSFSTVISPSFQGTSSNASRTSSDVKSSFCNTLVSRWRKCF